MSCPTPIYPVWPVPGWTPATLNPGSVAQIVPPTNILPSGSGIAFLQLSVLSPSPGDAIGPTDANGNEAGNPVRVQVADIWNDAIGFAQVFGNAIYVRNYSSHTVNAYVVFLGYA